jgi:colanic acid/amylovoran biosynthesis glycosyltransferase
MATSTPKSESLRIAVFTGTFPAVSETFIVRQITGLIGRGHTVDIFADVRGDSGVPLDHESSLLLDRVAYMDMPPETAPWEIPLWPLTARTWPPGSEKSVHNSVRFARALPKFFRCFTSSPHLTLKLVRTAEYGYRAQSFSQVYRMARLLKTNGGYDVLHAHFGPVAESFRFTRELWRAPFIASFHGYDFTTIPRREGQMVYTRLFQTADGITANSDFTTQRLIELGCPKNKLHRLPMGLDPARFPFRERTRVPDQPVRILMIARLVPIKGVAFALDAIAKVKESCPQILLDVVGDGPSRSELEQHAHNLGIGTMVRFHGALAGAALQLLMDAAHLFLHLSVTIDGDQEGQGLVLQEAQAVGLPVVATRHGAFPEGILDGESGFLVPERDASAAAERLVCLINNPQLWPEMGRKGRAFVEARFNINALNTQLENVYSEVIDKFPCS